MRLGINSRNQSDQKRHEINSRNHSDPKKKGLELNS